MHKLFKNLYTAFLLEELYYILSLRAEIEPSFNLLEFIYYLHILSRNKLFNKLLYLLVEEENRSIVSYNLLSQDFLV